MVKLQFISEGFSKYLSFVFFIGLLVLILFTYGDYGISWDEPFQHEYGQKVLRYYTSGFKDRSAVSSSFLNLQYYGGFFEVVAVLCTLLLPFDVYETRHLIYALFGLFGILGSWKLARFLANPTAAFWTSFLLALSPSYYGHMFINSKDIPFAVLHVWSLYYLLRFVKEFPGAHIGLASKLGVLMGLCMAVRVGGLLLLCYVWMWSLLYFGYLLSMRRVSAEHMKKVLVALCMITFIAYSLMLLFWPYALSKPLVRPFTALRSFTSYYKVPTPRDYIPRYLAVKLPEIVIVLVVIAGFWGIRQFARKARAGPAQQLLPHSVLTFAVVFPVIYVIVKKVNFYDEVRHLLFIIPPLYCIAGITLTECLKWTCRSLWTRIATFAVLGLYFIYHVTLMMQLHPYEYIYYNRFIGGVNGADHRGYETDYWVTGYREGIKELEDYLRKKDGSQFETRSYQILVSSAPQVARYYFPRNFNEATSRSDAQIYVATTRGDAHNQYDGRTVITVQRFGVPFVFVKMFPE